MNLDLVDTLDLDLEELESMDPGALDALGDPASSPDKRGTLAAPGGGGMKIARILQGATPVHRRMELR